MGLGQQLDIGQCQGRAVIGMQAEARHDERFVVLVQALARLDQRQPRLGVGDQLALSRGLGLQVGLLERGV